MQDPSVFLKRVPPDAKFWRHQFFALGAVFFIPIVFMVFMSMLGIDMQDQSKVFIRTLGVQAVLILVWLVQHAIATFRASALASTPRSSALCQIYSIFSIVLGFGFLYFVINVPRYQAAARQSEAKIAMEAIAGAERAFFKEYGRYTSRLDSLGYTPEGQRRFYILAFVTCTNSKRDTPEIQDAGPLKLETAVAGAGKALRNLTENEDCSKRAAGFTIFAAGWNPNASPERAVDAWRADESNESEHIADGWAESDWSLKMEQWRAAWAKSLSFFKRDQNWTIEDYPIRMRTQNHTVTDAYRYSAQIINWWTMTGLGATPDQARENLAKAFGEYRKHNDTIPRPGTSVPIKFGSSSGFEEIVSTNEPIVDDFFAKIIGQDFRKCFISDQSSVLDFQNIDSQQKKLVKRINETYGLDLREDDHLVIVEILRKIVQKRSKL